MHVKNELKQKIPKKIVKRCYNYGSTNHLSFACKEHQFYTHVIRKVWVSKRTTHVNNEFKNKKKIKNKRCYNCGSNNHLSFACKEHQFYTLVIRKVWVPKGTTNPSGLM